MKCDLVHLGLIKQVQLCACSDNEIITRLICEHDKVVLQCEERLHELVICLQGAPVDVPFATANVQEASDKSDVASGKHSDSKNQKTSRTHSTLFVGACVGSGCLCLPLGVIVTGTGSAVTVVGASVVVVVAVVVVDETSSSEATSSTLSTNPHRSSSDCRVVGFTVVVE